MSVKLAYNRFETFFDTLGVIAPGGKLFTYVGGSVNTKQTTYTESTGSSQNTNPIVLDSAGRLPQPLWITTGVSYKFVLAPSTDTDPPVSPIWTLDGITGINDSSSSQTEWVSGPAPTFVSTTQFTLVGDQTSTFTVGRRARFTVTAGTVYGRITASAFGALTTITMQMDGAQVLDSGLSAVSYGLLGSKIKSEPERIATSAGTDTYTATVGIATLNIGDEYKVKIANANTSATPTLNLDGLGAKTVVSIDGGPLLTNDLNGEHLFRWNGTSMVVLNPNRIDNSIVNGRLTLTTVTPVTTADVTAAGTLFFTPYKGDRIALFDGTSIWSYFRFAEISIGVPAATSQMYDVFAFNNSGVVALELLAWTNDTTRATALALQNGVLVKTGATTRRYLGSMRSTTVASQTEDSLGNRFVWNYYNRVLRVTKKSFTANRSTAAGPIELNTEIRVNFIIGVLEDPVIGFVHGGAINGTASDGLQTSIGLDSTTVPQDCVQEMDMSAGGIADGAVAIEHAMFPAVGFHFATVLGTAIAGGTATWRGGASGNNRTHLKLNIQG